MHLSIFAEVSFSALAFSAQAKSLRRRDLKFASQVNDAVPICALPCVQTYIATIFASACPDQTDFGCLCRTTGTRSSTLGELAVGCLEGYQQEGLCQESDTSPDAISRSYNMCSAQTGALPNTQSSIVILLPSATSSSTVWNTVSVTMTTTSPATTSATTTSTSSEGRVSAAFFTPGASLSTETSSSPTPNITPAKIAPSNILIASGSATPTSPASDASDGQSQTLPIVGGVFGGIAALALVFALIFVLRRRRAKKQQPEREMQISAPLNTIQGLPSTGPIAAMYARRFSDERRASGSLSTPMGELPEMGRYNDARGLSSILQPPPIITSSRPMMPPSPDRGRDFLRLEHPSPNPSALLPDKPRSFTGSDRESDASGRAWSNALVPSPLDPHALQRPNTLLELNSHAGSNERMLGLHQQNLAEAEFEFTALQKSKSQRHLQESRLAVPTKSNLLMSKGATQIPPPSAPRSGQSDVNRAPSKSSCYTRRAPSNASTQYLPKHLQRAAHGRSYSAASITTTIDWDDEDCCDEEEERAKIEAAGGEDPFRDPTPSAPSKEKIPLKSAMSRGTRYG